MKTVNLNSATQESFFSVPSDTQILRVDQSPSLGEIRLPNLPDLTELHISRSGKSIHSFHSVPNLRTLTIANTPFVSIDSSIGSLRHLTKLSISLNFLLSELPDEIGDLENLENLEISYTAISEFPNSFSRLSSLKVLRLSGNELQHVPDFVHRLPSLVELNLSENNIRIIPDTFSALSRLDKLNVDNNPRLENIPSFLLRITEYDKPAYNQTRSKLKRQTQKSVFAKQQALRLIRKTRSSSQNLSYSVAVGFARDPILLTNVKISDWLKENPKDNFILEHRESAQLFALKKSYFKSVVPYFVLESCDDSNIREYISIDKYGIPLSAIIPLASIRYLAGSSLSHFRISVSDKEIVNTRPKLLIKNTIIRDVNNLHASHISVLPERLIPYVRSYSHRWDTYINHFLRSGHSIDKYADENPKFYVDFAASMREGKRQLIEFIDSLDEAFENFAEVSDSDITVYRGTKDDPNMAPYLGIVAGFTSTSTDRTVAETFSSGEHNCCVYRLIISAGVPFISVKKYSLHSTEEEILLPRGVFTELVDTIPGVDGETKEYVVRVRLVNESQFKQHRYDCKTYPVARISAVHQNKRTTQKLK